jgi:hypothetical protein
MGLKLEYVAYVRQTKTYVSHKNTVSMLLVLNFGLYILRSFALNLEPRFLHGNLKKPLDGEEILKMK